MQIWDLFQMFIFPCIHSPTFPFNWADWRSPSMPCNCTEDFRIFVPSSSLVCVSSLDPGFDHLHLWQLFFLFFISNFIKVRGISCCWKLCTPMIWMILNVRCFCVHCCRENICFMCKLCLSDTLNQVTYSFSEISVFVSLSSRLFLPTVLQMVQVHSSLCTYFILYCLHPLAICLLSFFSPCFSCLLVLCTLMASGLLVCMCDNPQKNSTS